MGRRPIIVKMSGGLGNQLFALAGGLAMSKAWDRPLEFDIRWFAGNQRAAFLNDFRRDFELHRFPRIEREYPLAEYPVRKRPQSRIENWLAINVDNLEKIPAHPVRRRVHGLFFKPAWFSHLRRELRALLVLPAQEEEELQEFLRSLPVPTGRTICLHVRRGDNVISGNLNPTMKWQFFQEALNSTRCEPSNVLVFSDSPEWCVNHPYFGQFRVVDEPDPTRTLRLMMMCDDFVLSPSTLGWWGAWLGLGNNKEVFIPEPFQPASPTQWQELRLPDWRALGGGFEPPFDDMGQLR